MSQETARFLDAAWRAADSAGTLIRESWLQPKEIDYKGAIDLVTSVDRESERKIVEIIRSHFPDHSILAEEETDHQGERNQYRWIIDPLDGTTFHHRGLPFYSTIISLQVGTQLELGVAFTPLVGDLFTVWRGDGCFQRNSRFGMSKRLQVSSTSDLNEAIIGYSYGKSKPHLEDMSARLKRLLPHCRALTRVGGADIGYVAAGNCDAFIDNSSTPWDFAAMALMVEEAGGLVTNFSGERWTPESRNIVFSNRLLHSQILHLLNTSP